MLEKSYFVNGVAIPKYFFNLAQDINQYRTLLYDPILVSHVFQFIVIKDICDWSTVIKCEPHVGIYLFHFCMISLSIIIVYGPCVLRSDWRHIKQNGRKIAKKYVSCIISNVSGYLIISC